MIIQVTEENFPDEKLREVLIARYGKSIDNDNFKILIIDSNDIVSLKGIDKFTNLTAIEVYPNKIRTIDDIDLSKFPNQGTQDLKTHFIIYTPNQLTEFDITKLCPTGITSIPKSNPYCYDQVRYGLSVTLTGKEDYPYKVNLRDYVKEESIEIINKLNDVGAYSQAPQIASGTVTIGGAMNSKYYNGEIQCASLPQTIRYLTQPITPPTVSNLDGVRFYVYITRDIDIITETFKKAMRGKEYRYPIEAESSSLTLPMKYSIISGTLPPGLTLNTSTGVISGTPT